MARAALLLLFVVLVTTAVAEERQQIAGGCFDRRTVDAVADYYKTVLSVVFSSGNDVKSKYMQYVAEMKKAKKQFDALVQREDCAYHNNAYALVRSTLNSIMTANNIQLASTKSVEELVDEYMSQKPRVSPKIT